MGITFCVSRPRFFVSSFDGALAKGALVILETFDSTALYNIIIEQNFILFWVLIPLLFEMTLVSYIKILD